MTHVTHRTPTTGFRDRRPAAARLIALSGDSALGATQAPGRFVDAGFDDWRSSPRVNVHRRSASRSFEQLPSPRRSAGNGRSGAGRVGADKSKVLDLARGAPEHVAELAGLPGVERASARLGEEGAAEVMDRKPIPFSSIGAAAS